MIVFTVVGLYANLYVFWLFSWPILLCSCALPWSGYVVAYGCARLLRQSPTDCVTIAIEAGVQNLGVAFAVLLYAFPEPERDLAMVVPIAVALVTDKPLLLIFLARKCMRRKPEHAKKQNPVTPPTVHLEEAKTGVV